MALDSFAKRASVPGVGRPWMRSQAPNSTPDVTWRASAGLAYGGNGIEVPGIPTLPPGTLALVGVGR